MRTYNYLIICLVLLSFFKGSVNADEIQLAIVKSYFTTIKPEKNLNPAKVKLGLILYKDKRFSKNNDVSCFSCHDLGAGGVDHLKSSTGTQKRIGDFNSPTVYNSHLNFVQTWNGRAASLEDQLDGPVGSEVEFGSSWNDIVEKLQKDKAIMKLYTKIYNSKMTSDNLKNALVEFERSLSTPDSKFDEYLRGKIELSLEEKSGLKLFINNGCVSCHQGEGIGGNLFQKLGVIIPYFDKSKKYKKFHYGKFNISKKERDKFVFKVPSLRNITLTAPYFHDGSIATLDRAIELMGFHQLGIKFSKKEVQEIKAFLKTLTGKVDGELIK